MEIICSGCNSKFIVPDEKIPKGKVAKIKCPKCGEKITIKAEEETITEEFPEIENYMYSEDELSETYEEGAKLALFVGDNNNLLSQISQTAEDMGYKLISTSDLRSAIGKIRLHQFDLIILQEGFGGDIKHNPVMKYINRLPMAIRRKSFVVLLSKKYKTFDQMMAFALSVNLIINIDDLSSFSKILNNAIKKHQIFYKPFFEVMKEIGRL